MDSNKPTKQKRGPKEDRLAIDDDWEDAVKQALGKVKPATGWPEEPEKKGEKDGD